MTPGRGWGGQSWPSAQYCFAVLQSLAPPLLSPSSWPGHREQVPGAGFLPVLLVPPFPQPAFNREVREMVAGAPRPTCAVGEVSSLALADPLCLLSFPLPGCLLETVTELCNVACSSVMPGGGTNLELALHCLHEAQGNIQVRCRRGWAQRSCEKLPALLRPGALGARHVPSTWGFAAHKNQRLATHPSPWSLWDWWCPCECRGNAHIRGQSVIYLG